MDSGMNAFTHSFIWKVSNKYVRYRIRALFEEQLMIEFYEDSYSHYNEIRD